MHKQILLQWKPHSRRLSEPGQIYLLSQQQFSGLTLSHRNARYSARILSLLRVRVTDFYCCNCSNAFSSRLSSDDSHEWLKTKHSYFYHTEGTWKRDRLLFLKNNFQQNFLTCLILQMILIMMFYILITAVCKGYLNIFPKIIKCELIKLGYFFFNVSKETLEIWQRHQLLIVNEYLACWIICIPKSYAELVFRLNFDFNCLISFKC